MNAREEFDAACQALTKARLRLDIARKHLHTYRRQVAGALPFGYQRPQRDELEEQALAAVRWGIERVDAAKLVWDEKYEALPDKTEADSWS